MKVSSDFVNREKELQQVEDAVDVLQDKQRLLRTPIIEYHGVQGIGKSILLREIKALCDNRHLFNIAEKAEHFTVDALEDAKPLLREREPVVVILDALDDASAEQLQKIETTLEELFTDNDKLFIILASRNRQSFDNSRSISRKLTIHHLQPLEQKYCSQYLDARAQALSSQERDLIFEWTRGYPLAMKVMTDAIVQQHLNPLQDEGRIIRILIEEVIEKNLLANVASSAEKERLQTLLALLSIPRRFNLILIQNLIKEFASQYQLVNNLAYITLPPSINEATSALEWSAERAGYCIDASVRNLFIRQYRIEQPQRYTEIHKFLALKNKEFAEQVTGSDRIRYLREFFYHLACSEENRVQEKLAQHLEQLVQPEAQSESISLQSLDEFLQFYEEFQPDGELREALQADNTRFALSVMRKSFLKIYRQLPEGTRGPSLRKFFSHTAQKATTEDFALIFEDGMRQIIRQESLEYAGKLFQELMQDKEVKDLLGENFDQVQKGISKLLEEGPVNHVD